jgi:hypothetical protein
VQFPLSPPAETATPEPGSLWCVLAGIAGIVSDPNAAQIGEAAA